MAQRSITPVPTKDRLSPGELRLPMSYEEYQEWFDKDAGRFGEWVDGEVVAFMPPSQRHQDIVLWLGALLKLFVRRSGLGTVIIAPFEMRLEHVRSAREPDIVFVASTNEVRLDGKRLNGPADLAVEITSPDSVTRDQRAKLAEYAAAGAPEYWIIDPRPLLQSVQVFGLSEDGAYSLIAPSENGVVHSIAAPGYWLDPTWLTLEQLPDELDTLRLIAPQLLET